MTDRPIDEAGEDRRCGSQGVDEDGRCRRCGLAAPDPAFDTTTECPPGFFCRASTAPQPAASDEAAFRQWHEPRSKYDPPHRVKRNEELRSEGWQAALRHRDGQGPINLEIALGRAVGPWLKHSGDCRLVLCCTVLADGKTCDWPEEAHGGGVIDSHKFVPHCCSCGLTEAIRRAAQSDARSLSDEEMGIRIAHRVVKNYDRNAPMISTIASIIAEELRAMREGK